MIDDRTRLQHILEAIERIESYTKSGSETFFTNSMVQDAVVRNIQIIGEASRALSDEFKAAHPEIPWREIAGSRNMLVHEYFRVDLEIVWTDVQAGLARLKGAVQLHLERFDR